MAQTQNILSLRTFIARRFHSGFFGAKHCVAILDMLAFACTENPAKALKEVPNVRYGPSVLIRKPEKAGRYKRAQWFNRTDSRMKACLYSEPIHGWLSPFKIVMYADDKTGLLPGGVFSLLEVMSSSRLLMVELALDFSALTGVTEHFVRRHAVFGKSQRDRSTDNPSGDWWGPRKGKKRIKSYYKHLVWGHRIEFVMRRAFLESRGIDTVFDFRKFAELLPDRHLLFARIDQERLIERLRVQHHARKTLRIVKALHALDGDLVAQMQYLRRTGELRNTRRLLVPLQTNRLVRQALAEWAAMWPALLVK